MTLMTLKWLPVNSAWCFVFGSTPCRLDGEDLFFSNRAEATAAAKRRGLRVYPCLNMLCVESDNEVQATKGN